MVLAIVLGVVGLILVAAAALLGYVAVRLFRRASRLGIRPAHAAKLKPGPCKKVRGKVVAVGAPLRSPLTNQACVYYRLSIDEERRKWKTRRAAPSGGAVAAGILGGAVGALLYGALAAQQDEGTTEVIHSWDNVLDDVECTRLVVEDATGRVEVDLRDAEVVTKDSSRVHADLNKPAPHQLGDFVRKRYKVHTVDEGGRVKTMRFVEKALKEGAKVTVVGPVAAGPDGGLRFQNKGGALLVSERDVGKEGRFARNWAVGLAAAAGACLLLAAGAVVAAVVLAG
jgi:hypothetical protein